jgi:hypothetical protein
MENEQRRSSSAACPAQQQQQHQPVNNVVLVPPTATSCSLPRWATLEFPLPIESSATSASSINIFCYTTKKQEVDEKEDDQRKVESERMKRNAILSREEAYLRTQTFHSVSLQLDSACQQAMQKLYHHDDDDDDVNNDANNADDDDNKTNETATTTIRHKKERGRRSIQQALQAFFQETAAMSCTTASPPPFPPARTTTTTTTTTTPRAENTCTDHDDDDDDDDSANSMNHQSTKTRKRQESQTTTTTTRTTAGDEKDAAIANDEPAATAAPNKRVRRLEEHEQQQQQQRQQRPPPPPPPKSSSPHDAVVSLLRNRFLAAISTTSSLSCSSNIATRKATPHMDMVTTMDETKNNNSSLLLPVLLMQGPYHALDRWTWMQFLVEQSRRRRHPPQQQQQQQQRQLEELCPVPPAPLPAVVWLQRPAAGLATSWPAEILRQLLLLLQSTENHYMSSINPNPQLAAQARWAYTACCHCPLTGRKRKSNKSSLALIGRILQTWARHVEGLFSGIVVYVDVLDTLVSSSSSSNANTSSRSPATAANPDHSSYSSSSAFSSSSSLDWKDLLAWLSHQRAGLGLPVSCVLMVPPANGHGLLSFDSSSFLQGIGAGMNVQQVVLPTTRHFLTTLQDCLQEQEQQHGNSRCSGDSRLLQLVQQAGSIMNQHEHDADVFESLSLSSSSSMAAIPALMDWKRYVAQILTRRSSFLPFWLLQHNQHDQPQQQYDLKLHVSWFLRHPQGREFLLHDSNYENALPLVDVGVSSGHRNCKNTPSSDRPTNNKNDDQTTPGLWQWLQQSRQWHLLVEMARSIEQAACRRQTTTSTVPSLLLLPSSSRANPNERNDQEPLEHDNRRAILAILFRYRQQYLQCTDKKDDSSNKQNTGLKSRNADAVDAESYGKRLSRHLLEEPFANDEHARRRVLHQINQLVILVDQCTQVSQVHRLIVSPILKGWTMHLEWLFSETLSSSSSFMKSVVQQAQPRRQTTAGLLSHSLGSATTCLPISSLERLPGILYGLILNRVSIPQDEWFFEYFQRLRQYQQQQAQEPRYSRQEAFALFCCGTQHLKILGLIKERRRQQRAVNNAAARAAIAGSEQQPESSTTSAKIISGIVYDKISLVFCGGHG